MTVRIADLIARLYSNSFEFKNALDRCRLRPRATSIICHKVAGCIRLPTCSRMLDELNSSGII